MFSTPHKADRLRPSALASLAAAVLFWAILPILLKYFTHVLDAWTVNGTRYTFAMFFWLPYLLRTPAARLPGRLIWRDAIPPAAAHVVGQILFALAPYFNDATVINFVSRSGFLFATIFGFSFLREERPLARSGFFWMGFSAAVAGLVAMYWGGRNTASTSTIGMAILLAASACWGLYSVLVRRFMHGYSTRHSYGVIAIYAGPWVIALMFLVGRWQALGTLHAGQWAALFVSAIAGLALGHVFFFEAIHSIGPITAEASLLVMPFLTGLLAAFFLGERLGALQWTGGLILVAGCFLLLLAKWRRERGVSEFEEDAVLPAPR